jgi:DNA-binding transcriptional LysR family regulator
MVFAHLLTPILTEFITAYPAVALELTEANDVGLEQAVIDGQLDCAVYTAFRSTRAAARHLLTEEILAVVAQDHPLATRDTVTFRMLAKENILLPPAPLNVSAVIADAFRQAGVEPKLTHRLLYPELIKNLVRTGWGVAPMPRSLTSPEALDGLVAIPFEEKLVRELLILYPWDRPLPPAARLLMAHLHRHVSPGGPSPGSAGKQAPDRSRRPRRTVEDSQA